MWPQATSSTTLRLTSSLYGMDPRSQGCKGWEDACSEFDGDRICMMLVKLGSQMKRDLLPVVSRVSQLMADGPGVLEASKAASPWSSL